VFVFPDPVTPSNVCASIPGSEPATNRSMASGWSPAGSNGASTRKGHSALGLSGESGPEFASLTIFAVSDAGT
jgi:hypothetical protein